MTARHAEAFIEQALVKAFSRGSRSITSVAEELNLSHHTLRSWMKKKSASMPASAKAAEKRPQDWTAEEQLAALRETRGKMTAIPQRQSVMALVAEAVVAGARQEQACAAIDLSERTLQRWQDDARAAVGDRRPTRVQKPVNALSELARTPAGSGQLERVRPFATQPNRAQVG